MSRQSQLPPRCPFQTKNTTFNPSHDSLSPTSSNDRFAPRNQESISQSFDLLEQPPWLDDILNEADENPKGSPLRRSVSDSVTLSGAFVSGLESSCVFGPNSPRSRESKGLSGNNVVSRLTDYFSQSPTFSGLIESRTVSFNMIQDAGGLADLANVDSRSKRQSAQRSRVRKLQYISELERTVEVLQSMGNDLAIKVSSLLQHRAALLLENNTLKQKLARISQEKVFLEGQHLSLTMELDGLKSHFPYSAGGNYVRYFKPPSRMNEEASLGAVLEMLDISKINLHQ